LQRVAAFRYPLLDAKPIAPPADVRLQGSSSEFLSPRSGDIQIPLGKLAPGLYLVEAYIGRHRATTVVFVSDTVAVTKLSGHQLLVWTAQRDSGAAVAGAKLLVSDGLGVLERLAVPGTRGPVMLGQVATLELTGGPAVIDRYDRSRNINFEIELSGLPLGDVAAAVQELPAVKNLPAGVKVVEIGDAEVMGELFASFGLAMLTGVLCIYIVLVLLFKDFLHPVTILAALPLALGGAFVGLLMAQKSFSMPSLIGLIMLMGVATKNSILLVEYAIVARRDQGMSRWDALMDACHKRARPIIMTTIAMGAGMLPIAIGWGAADPSFRSPMAVAVIGGLITSTVLSLIVIPAVFTYVDDLGQWFSRLWSRRKPTSGGGGVVESSVAAHAVNGINTEGQHPA
jgi:Cu/Ag efflux pump CusA